jgi:zinc D-Ala-D-Ala carboxypeptidase
MSQTSSARTTAHRSPLPAAVGLLVVAAALVGSIVLQPASSSAPSFGEVPPREPSGTASEADGALTAADGVLPDGVSTFDDRYPGVANLDPELLRALRAAATDAADDGIVFSVNSGWRSPEYQNELRREAVSEYGSAAEAAHWVATADTSAHVSGDAVDLGSSDATAWLADHGAAYGLCRTYDNESWHYELRPAAIGAGCPPRYADPTQDPRMQQ